MTIRYTAQPKTMFGVPGLPSGYQTKSTPDDLTIPSVGIDDIDKALFDLFNEQIPFAVDGHGAEMRRPPVVFYSGEKWALMKKNRALRDRNNSLILPLITGVRTSIVQDLSSDIAGRGINQQTGEIVIQRRLDKSDREYQQLVNRLLLQHQQNLAVGINQAETNQLTTLQEIGDLERDGVIQQGGLLLPDRTNNVYETIVIPAPQFFTSTYEITFWTQYNTHMTQLLQELIGSQLPQGNCWKLDSPKGYWFIASVEGNQYTAENNTDDYSQTERILKHKFVIKVPGYIFASNVPGAPVPIKRYVSSPTISFQTGIHSDVVDEGSYVDDPFLGADDPTLPLKSGDTRHRKRRDLRETEHTLLYPSSDDVNNNDPAMKQLARGTSPAQYQKIVGIDSKGKKVTRYLRVKGVNRAAGETVLSADANLGGLTIVINED